MLIWCVMCSDPGIVNREQDESKLRCLVEWKEKIRTGTPLTIDYTDELLDLNDYEMAAINDPNKSLFYRESRFYQYRDCTTCEIQRLPKSSHCGNCNNCVKGFDHHCTLLNNCVGLRTLRAFICLLNSAFIFYFLSGVIAAIAILYEPYSLEYALEGTMHFDFDMIVSLLIVVLQIVKFILLCCLRRCVSFSVAVNWIIVEAVLVLGLAIATLDGPTIVCAPMLSLGWSFMLFVWPLLTKHMNFIVHHLTEKEFHARLETMNRLQTDDILIKEVKCGQKCTNLLNFCFRRRIPPSEL